MTSVIVDAGFLIALFDDSAPLHAPCRAGLLEVDREPLDFGAIEKLARKYADQPMDFADASVVLLAARTGVREILTADRRDFAVYRLAGRLRFIDVLAKD